MGDSFDKLNARLTDLHNLSATEHILFWDQNVMMPPGGASARAAQMATLQRVQHEILTSDETARLIEDAAAEVNPDNPESDAATLIRLAKSDYEHASALPTDFVAEYARVTAAAFDVWRKAKEENDFASFAPILQQVMDLKLQEAEIRGYDDHPYDVLLGHWERGMKTSRVRELFDAHRPALIELVAGVNAHADRVDDSILHQPFDLDQQRQLALFISGALGVDYDEKARLDTAPHPFCLQISRDDMRVTTFYQPGFFNPAFFSTLHETGHGLHGKGIRPEYDGTFFSNMEGYSHALAESQSRTWENLVGRSREFWEWAFPHVRDHFPEQFKNADAETVYRAVNRSYPQMYRVRADELTYNLHIMLRFEVELPWVEGKVTVNDLPELWRETMRQFFGIVPETDSEGLMQDVHWSMGGMGAFNGYAIGTIMASQFYEAALADQPDIPAHIARGEFGALHDWLTERIYQHGRKYDAEETAVRVTGEPINTRAYVAYLREKFSDLYGL